jgi:hypothetical protein
MEQITYLDFDMLIESVEGGYAVRVLSSPAGEASSKFVLPFSDLELDNIALQLGRTRRGVRRLESPEMEVARNFGRRLFDAVFDQEVRDRLRGSLGSVNRQGHGLRIRLRLAGAPELANLPWEYLYDPSLDRFLVLSVQTPLVRYLEVPQAARPLAISPPLNVVLMISSPNDYSPLELEHEWENLKGALGSLERRGLVSLTRLEAATLDSLLRKLRTGEHHIFHFIGHGGFDRQAEDGVLVLEDDHHNSRLVSGRYLGTILHDHRSMRLAILNACEGARTSRNDPFAGVAQSLVQQGIPSVVAMQFEITDQAAITFSRELYEAIALGYPIDAALAEARKAIFAQDNDVEWGTPVLYLCSPDGVIFDVMPAEKPASQVKLEESTPDLEIEARIEQLYTEGLSAFWLEEWEKASQLFQSILDLQPDHQEASIRLSEAERQLNLQTLYERAVSAQSEADWQGALSTLGELSELEPNYRDVPTRIETAKRQSQLAELYREAHQLHQAGKWQAVINIFAKIEAIDPKYPDQENLRATAEEEAEAEKRQTELESLYARAVREMDAEDWEAARQSFLQVQEMQPRYQQADRLLQRVEIELSHQAANQQRDDQLARLYDEARRLAEANQWQQVQSKLIEIHELDPQFPDPDGLAGKAQQKLEDEKQKANQAKKLDAMYSQAVQLTQAGKYQKALAKWDQIRSLDASYTDSQNVYAKATQGLKEAEKPPKPAASRFTFPALGSEWAIVVIVYGWLLGGLFIAPLQAGLAFPLTGLLFGTVLWFGLHFRIPTLNRYHLAGLVLGWAVGLSIVAFGGGGILLNTINGTVGGAITAIVIFRAIPDIPKARLVIITLGWATSLFIGELVIRSFSGVDFDLAVGVGFCAAGLIGGWVTLEAIRKEPLRRPNWLLIVVSITGFIIGVVLADLILSVAYESNNLLLSLLGIAIWGLLGGAALGISSRNYRKIALLGAAGAVGMLVGVLIWSALGGFNDSIIWHLDDLHWHSDINLFLGLGLGLLLGLTTRRVTAVLILPIVGVAAFLVATFVYMILGGGEVLLGDVAGGAIIGGILGLAWGYLENPKLE